MWFNKNSEGGWQVEQTELRMGCTKRRSSWSRRTSGGIPSGPQALPFFICLLAMSTSSIVMSPIEMSCSMSPSPGKMRLMVKLSEWVVLLFSRFSKWVFQPAKWSAGLLALIFSDALDFLPERLLMAFQTSDGFLLSSAAWYTTHKTNVLTTQLRRQLENEKISIYLSGTRFLRLSSDTTECLFSNLD